MQHEFDLPGVLIANNSSYSREASGVFAVGFDRSIALGHPFGTDDLLAGLLDAPVCQAILVHHGLDIEKVKEKLAGTQRTRATTEANQIEMDALRFVLRESYLMTFSNGTRITPEAMLANLLLEIRGIGYQVIADALHESNPDKPIDDVTIDFVLFIQQLETTRRAV